MSRGFMVAGAGLCILVLVFFASWPVWQWLTLKPVSASLHQRTKAAVDKNAHLKAAWDIALQDGVLTWPEAKVILEGAGEKAEPE